MAPLRHIALQLEPVTPACSTPVHKQHWRACQVRQRTSCRPAAPVRLQRSTCTALVNQANQGLDAFFTAAMLSPKWLRAPARLCHCQQQVSSCSHKGFAAAHRRWQQARHWAVRRPALMRCRPHCHLQSCSHAQPHVHS